eukprot:4221864-Pleurochrysis_carterae.AAC.1
MSPDNATSCMHNRLQAGANRLRALPSITADAPRSLSHGQFKGCAACTEANASRLAHNTVPYKPSYPGRLIHADIAGPSVRTQNTGYKYLLVLIDDQTRFKAIHFLKNKEVLNTSMSEEWLGARALRQWRLRQHHEVKGARRRSPCS